MSAESGRGRMVRRAVRVLAGPLALLSAAGGLAGCARAGAPVAVIPGARVARMAEARLEADHPGIPPGTLTCPDLEFVVGASTRCLRTALLSRGRVVRVLGTIRLISMRAHGELYVALDDTAVGFGLDGPALANRVRRRLHALAGATESVTCPYLEGTVGASVTCTVDAAGGPSSVRVAVTGVRPATYDVDVRIEPGPAGAG